MSEYSVQKTDENRDAPSNKVKIEFIRKFICQSCSAGWDNIDDGFKSGCCACCGAPAGKLDALVDAPKEVDLAHTILVLTVQNPSSAVEDFVTQIRVNQVKVVTLSDIMPAKMSLFQMASTIEAIVKAARLEVAVFSPGYTKDRRFSAAVEASMNEMDHFFIPIYENMAAYNQVPGFITSRSGGAIDPRVAHEIERGVNTADHVIEQLVHRLQDAEEFYGDSR